MTTIDSKGWTTDGMVGAEKASTVIGTTLFTIYSHCDIQRWMAADDINEWSLVGGKGYCRQKDTKR